MKKQGTIVFLYTELASYIRACMEHLAGSGVEVHVMAWPVNPEAPFDFDQDNQKARYYNRNSFGDKSLLEWMKTINPTVVVCSGWLDQGYLRCIRQMRVSTLTVLALDNPSPNTLKGRLGLMRARIRFKPLFHLAWVPGMPQKAYALSMGFKDAEIFEGFYCADTAIFAEAFRKRPPGQMARRFLFVGRYVDFKGVKELWEAFRQFRQWQEANALPLWELHCAGTGPLYEERPKMAGLKHYGFVQPHELNTFVSAGGVFVLPSYKEPWGVVVQEMAAAGLPLVLSSSVGAASAFLEKGRNGISVAPRSAKQLLEAMKYMAGLSVDALCAMGAHSRQLALNPSHQSWLQTALKLLDIGNDLNTPGTPGHDKKQPLQ